MIIEKRRSGGLLIIFIFVLEKIILGMCFFSGENLNRRREG